VYNEDNDDYISAFELSHALDAFVPKGRKSVPHTTDHLLRKEVEFLNFIKFQTIALPDSLPRASRIDPISGLVDKQGVVPERTVYPYGERADGVILVRPFHRLLLRADVPVMDDETFPYDHLIMLKYRWNPLLKPSAAPDEDDIDEVSEVKHSKTYVHEATNELMLGRRDTSWNAFRSFVRVEDANGGGGGEGKEKEKEGGASGKEGPSVMVKKSVVPPGFSESSNFEEIDREELLVATSGPGVGEKGEKAAGAKFKPDPFVTPTRILYGEFHFMSISSLCCCHCLVGSHKIKVIVPICHPLPCFWRIYFYFPLPWLVILDQNRCAFFSPTSPIFSFLFTVPYLLEPGYYSPRFCVDAYDGDARNKQKMAKSAKSYYRSFSTPLPYCASTDEVRKEVLPGCAAEPREEERGEEGGGFGGDCDEANLITAREAAYNENVRIQAYNSKLGVLVKCLDVLELVFAEDIALESQFHEVSADIVFCCCFCCLVQFFVVVKIDHEQKYAKIFHFSFLSLNFLSLSLQDGDDSDNDNDNDNADIVQKTGFRPQLSRYYPYLPDRELENFAPMDVEVYVNIPSRRGASAADLTFVPTKIALFLGPEEKLMEKSVKAVTSRTKRYKYSKSLLKEVVEGLFGGDTGITAISFLIGFVDESGKNRLPCSPAVTLAFDERAEEEGEDEYVEEEEGDEEGGNEVSV